LAFPTVAHAASFDTDGKELYIDNCATACITNDPNACATTPILTNRRVKGISGMLDSKVYETTIKWDIEDDDGVAETEFIPKSFYIPNAPNSLLCPQHWARTRNNKPGQTKARCVTYGRSIILEWEGKRRTRSIPLNVTGSNVAMIKTAPGFSAYQSFCHECSTTPFEEDYHPVTALVNVIEDDEEETPLTADQLEDEHPEIYFPTRDMPLATEFNIDGPTDGQSTPAIVTDEEDGSPQDSSVELLRLHHRFGHLSMTKLQEMARQGMLPKRLSECRVPMCTSCLFGKATRKPWRTKPTKAKAVQTVTRPGQCVSVDQLISTTPGLIAQLRGKPTTKRYQAATVFVDQYSGLGFIHLQKTTSADETIEGKEKFEAYAASCGVNVSHYHADNGIFADNKFRQAVRDSQQTLSFCGVNAHFQNSVAERRIRELQDSARTMLIHANRRWPTAIDAHLWPYALRYANDMYNHAPLKRNNNIPPMELFSGTKVAFNPRHAHTFGCPVYVLDNTLQQGKKVDKWTERSRVGIFLGLSPQHARTVALVLSLTSGLTSPQFHTNYDEGFQTMRRAFGDTPPTSNWQYICGFHRGKAKPSQPTPTTSPADTVAPATSSATTSAPAVQRINPVDPGMPQQEGAPQQDNVAQPADAPAETLGTRRSPRTPKPTDRYLQYKEQQLTTFVAYEAISYLETDPSGEVHPFIALKTQSDPDTMYWHQAMKEPDRPEFLKAAQKEVGDHTQNGLWELVLRSTVPSTALIAPAVWSMKRKRRINTREIYKWKARLAYDGSKQTKDVNYWATYSPVVQWPAVRFLLTHALINKWHFKQINYVLAYTQAGPETNLYMKIPKGFEVEGNDPSDEYVLRIKKNYYGQKQAGRVWYQHLRDKLIQAGFTVSQHDDCVFYHGNAVYTLYTDDSILMGPDATELDNILETIKATGLNITSEDGLNDFLGVNIHHEEDGSIRLTQPHLIDSILKDLRLDGNGVATKNYPASSTILVRRHLESPEFDQHFHYRAVIGKLNYLEKSTRPDIAYAIHQCARFSQDPREPHGKAVKWIGRYLLKTRTDGLILHPDVTKGFEVYVDADFAGNFHRTESSDPDTARSRTGYIILYAGCPIYWQSKLQTEIALSTTEAEVVAMSQALRATIPLMEMAKEMQALGFDMTATKPTVHCRVFEDNSAAIEMATNSKVRPRTKYMGTKWHHFRHHYETGQISILPIKTTDQPADMLTKALPREPFEKHRNLVMGWDHSVDEREYGNNKEQASTRTAP